MELALNVVILTRETTTSVMERYSSRLSSVAPAPGKENVGEREPQTFVPNCTNCSDNAFRYIPRNTVSDVPSVSFPRPFGS
jgi:hypothetical protein